MTAPGTLRPASEQANYAVPQDLPPVIIDDPSLPLVSIVTPSYNQGKFIRETVDSVLSQDYPNIEYWVIDGGSTDETLSVLKEYECDPRFHWISEKDEGQSDAINKGLAWCRGDIFNWLCSDDLFLPGAFRRVVSAWMSFPQPSVIYGWARLVDHRGNGLGYCPGQSANVTLRGMLRSESFPMQQATFAPTDHIRAVGGVDATLHYAMDLDLWVKLIETLAFRHIPYDLALYRLHGTSKTVSLPTRFIDDVGKILERAAERNLISTQQATSYTHLFAARVYLTPEARALGTAIQRAASAMESAPSIAPTALLILLKGMARAILGEKHWAGVRLVHTKWC